MNILEIISLSLFGLFLIYFSHKYGGYGDGE
jgi:hypothetical protein